MSWPKAVRITETAIALPRIRRGQIVIMHVDDFARLQRAPTAQACLASQAIAELAPMLREWVNGSPNTRAEERETVRDYDGRVVYTTAGEAQRLWLRRKESAAKREITVHNMGLLLTRCGFRRRSVHGHDGLKVYRYYTPAHLMDRQ